MATLKFCSQNLGKSLLVLGIGAKRAKKLLTRMILRLIVPFKKAKTGLNWG